MAAVVMVADTSLEISCQNVGFVQFAKGDSGFCGTFELIEDAYVVNVK